MLTSRDFVTGLRKLDIDRTSPVIVHASLSAFGEIQDGAKSVISALISTFDTIIMPVFTYKTMIIPEVGPADNAINYGSGKAANSMAEIYYPEMPADKMMGMLAEAFRTHPRVQRSNHPVLSFAGVLAKSILESQTIHEPLLPIHNLVDQEGWVLLMGVNHTVNTSIHYAEKLAGRKQFTRWALTEQGVVACHGFPGCSDGFDAIHPRLGAVTSSAPVGEARILGIPLLSLMDAVYGMLKADPLALLCERPDCARCNAVRLSVAQQQSADPDRAA